MRTSFIELGGVALHSSLRHVHPFHMQVQRARHTGRDAIAQVTVSCHEVRYQ